MLLTRKTGHATAANPGRHAKVVALLLTAGVSLQSLPAAALDDREAGQVVTILEKLVVESGSTVYYDEEAAEEWFQIDEGTTGLIAAAGFTRTTWKTAFDQTMTGFIASIPEAELEKLMDDFINQFGEATKMTPEQKAEAASLMGAEMGHFDGIRAKGAQYQDFVGPYAPRLRKITFQK
ncbi:hypothetical protein CN878_23690 [Ochrobactrum sp. 695/2009]|nr:hypothetical protein [Brucella intermedia]PJR92489.1 hypothetical protein CN881_08050 [Ochrobactrum sp. 721/2009]PJT13573.1 hypothetical protein CN880_23505 [Ochrobactrum sp. 720/2009]PJT18074.1 hypothetical protein CN879_23735 [Ochrobactrum sp. 715/2009]PJT21780.1 hypothetical protein CN878_23690 [Ochrobactrum sp. 695/2009]PJT31795.1 hypothetical protein CN877_23765 [Ochrobactrum sp. 689/2009]